MVQVHTVYEASAWRNTVDGLRQGRGSPSRACAVADGRSIAQELHARHYVHDIDGRVIEAWDFTERASSGPRVPAWSGAYRYTA